MARAAGDYRVGRSGRPRGNSRPASRRPSGPTGPRKAPRFGWTNEGSYSWHSILDDLVLKPRRLVPPGTFGSWKNSLTLTLSRGERGKPPPLPTGEVGRAKRERVREFLSLIHISEPTRLGMISYAVFCLK